MGLFLVIHMDPIETQNERVLHAKETVEQKVREIDRKVSIHDFRMVDGKQQVNLIFDMVVPHEYNEDKQRQINVALRKALKEEDERYQCVIHVEKGYGGQNVFN